MNVDVATLLNRHADATTGYLRDRLPEVARFSEAPPRLVEAINYSLLAAGKRLRPALVLETHATCLAAAAPGEPAGPSADPLPAAAAIELVHTFSLVHDDLPAMDDDALRRGRPTNHKVFGEALAILAGDAMLSLAFETLAVEYAASPAVAAALAGELSRAAGPAGMIGGQTLDIAAEGHALTVEELRSVHAQKTGALITAACRMGAIAADADERILEALTTYGRHLGLAFQIADDLLDVTSTTEAAGKATHKDTAAGKNTYPALLGLEAARAEAHRQAAAAESALAPLGPAADGLRALARFTIERAR